ncbi:MAG TPA: hypothetical protein VD833_08190 [Vicinamibacterales bacterium]|nr:hypothetical protein [Vicinamibacterales bacterium]
MAARLLLTCTTVLLTAGATWPGSGNRATPPATRAALAGILEVSDREFERLDDGHVVSRTLRVGDPREIGVLGMVRMRIPPELFVARLADIVRFKQDEAVRQIGVFSTPARLADVAGLTIDGPDVRALEDCRAGDCGVQLPAEAIGRFRTEVDWRRADAPARATVLMREFLVDYVGRYQLAGTDAGMAYADRSEPVWLVQEFASLLQPDRDGWQWLPALRLHLLEYPRGSPARTTSFIYWSKEQTGRRSVIGATHVAISRMPDDAPVRYAVASKHIYGTHYFDASLGLTLLVSIPGSSPESTCVVYINRSRLDVFGGVFGGVTRRIVGSRARATVAQQLGRLRQTLEREVAGGPVD